MRLRVTTIALVAALLAAGVGAGSAQAAPQSKVFNPRLQALGKDPAVVDLRHFLHTLRTIHHASNHRFHRLLAEKRHVTSEARDALEARDRKRQRALKAYLRHPGRHHRGRTERQSEDYYAYLRSVESHRVRQIVAAISDQIDRLAYS
jgi:hypothetical protein